jgi:hypothetical protein
MNIMQVFMTKTHLVYDGGMCANTAQVCCQCDADDTAFRIGLIQGQRFCCGLHAIPN